jgi:hypothetical protein
LDLYQVYMNQLPFRLPCESIAGSPQYFLGSPFQHALAPLLADKFTNTTVVENPDTEAGGTVAPYERFTQDFSGGDSCETHHCIEDGPAPCAPWPRPFTDNAFSHTPGDTVNFAVAHKTGFKNVMARRSWNGRFGYLNKETNDAPDTTECCGGTIAKWRAYTSAIDGTKYLSLAIDATWAQTTYDYSGGGAGVPTTITETFSMSQAINATSGLYTFSDLAISPNDDRNHALQSYAPAMWKWSDVIARMTVELTPVTGGSTKTCTDNSITIKDETDRLLEQLTWDLNAGTFTRQVYQWSSLGTELLNTDESVTVSNTEISYSLTTTDFNTPNSDPDGISSTTTLMVTGTLATPNTSATIYADVKNLLAEWDLADDAQCPWRADAKVSIAPLVSRDELAAPDFSTNFFAKNFGAPVTDAFGLTLGDNGWIGDCGILLAADPTTGTAIVARDLPVTSGAIIDTGPFNPFPHCAATAYSIIGGTLAPGLAFDSTNGRISGTAMADGHWGVTIQITGAAPAATGAVLGAPKPAGYQNYFDFNFLDIVGCCFRPIDNPGFQTWSWYQNGWGMDVATFNANSGCALPLNATQWTNYFQSVNKPPGAWIFYADKRQDYFGIGCVSSEAPSAAGDADALWACKYAEVLELWPSQNFAMPAGDAKFWFDENHVFCAMNTSGAGEGSTWTLTDPTTQLAPPDGTDFSGTWGGPVVDGFYNVASYASGTLTLGAKIYDVPSNWTSKSHSDKAACFGNALWASRPSLLGRAAITPDEAGTTFTFTTAQPAFGMDNTTHQEQIDLFDKDMTLLAANVTATRTDDSTFTVAPGSAAVSAAWAQITGAADYYVNDPSPKGDYAKLEWLADFRSYGEFTRLTGILDCTSTQVTQPSTNLGGGPIATSTQFASFTQTPGCLPFVPCAPKVVCISPNGENFANGITYDFPETFACDEQYGSKWWAYIQSTMTDLFWQRPHRPCNIEPCARWTMDTGACAADTVGTCPGDDDYVLGESEPPEYFFAHAPQVEARLTVPANYGAAQNETAPTLPDGIQIGWLSPVNFSTGDIAYPPEPPGVQQDHGNPASAATAWDLHALFCANNAGCRFNYKLPGC